MYGWFPIFALCGICRSCNCRCACARCGQRECGERTCPRRCNCEYACGGRAINASCGAGLVKMTKTSPWREVRVGEEVEVELTVANVSATELDLVIGDCIDGGVLVPDSVAIDGVAVPGADMRVGIPLTLEAGESAVINYRVRPVCAGCVGGAATARYAPSNTQWQCPGTDTAVSNTLNWSVRCADYRTAES